MKLTLRTLKESERALSLLATKTLPIKTSFHISRCIRKAEAELSVLEEQRIKLVTKHGTPDGEKITVAQDNMSDFLVDFNSLLEMEIDFDIQPLAIEALGNIDITPTELLTLEWFLTDTCST